MVPVLGAVSAEMTELIASVTSQIPPVTLPNLPSSLGGLTARGGLLMVPADFLGKGCQLLRQGGISHTGLQRIPIRPEACLCFEGGLHSLN